jgi:hypothetical protein
MLWKVVADKLCVVLCKPMEGNDVDDQPTPIIKLAEDNEYAQLQSNLVVEHPLEISIVDVTNIQSFMEKLNKMLFSNINIHSSKTIDSYFRSMIYGEDIIMGLYFNLAPYCVTIGVVSIFLE